MKVAAEIIGKYMTMEQQTIVKVMTECERGIYLFLIFLPLWELVEGNYYR